MLRLLTALLALLVVTAGSGLAAGAKSKAAAKMADFSSPEAIQRWITQYRGAPEPKRLPAAVKSMSQLGVFREIDSAGLYLGFAAGVIGANPQLAEKLLGEMFPLPPEDQIVVVRASAWSGLADWKTLMGKFVERMPARRTLIERHLYGKQPDLMNLPLDENAMGIDALWGYYYATGSSDPIRRLIAALAWSTEQNSVDKLTAGSMAKLTLAINASRDVDLLFILKREALKQGKATVRPLAEVIEAAETYETGKIRKQALAAIEVIKQKGPGDARKMSWWGTVGTTALAIGCVAASALGQVQVGIPCVVGGAASSAALKLFTPGN